MAFPPDIPPSAAPPLELPAQADLTPNQRRRYDLLLAGLDLLDQCIAVFDSEPRLVAWNRAFVEVLELPESLVRLGAPFADFIRYNAERGEYGPGDIDALVAERVAAARAFQPHYTERVRPNGQVLAIRGVPIPNLGFVSLWTDITEQRRYEAVIREQNAILEARVKARTRELELANARLAHANAEIDQIAGALRRSEERLRVIIDAIPALIAYVDFKRVYQFANLGYAEWFGLRKEEIVGRGIAEVFGVESYEQIVPYLDRASAGERVSYEYSRHQPDGRQVFARSVVVPELTAEGTVIGFFVLSIDITEQKASQAALVQAQKMEAVGQLTGGLAHDFNNLLTIIIGNLSVLNERLPAGDRAGDYVQPALHAAQRGAELIRRLLTFSRRQTLEPRAIEIGALVHNMTQLIARSISENIRIDPRLPEGPLYTLVDPHQLENALLNLAINARDAMPEGGTLSIAVTERQITEKIAQRVELPAGEYVQIDVSDTGSGISPEALGRVFEPFFTTKSFGQGSGLGLSMVYGFVRQSGGNIRIRSTPGQGSMVSFVLPRAQAPLPEGAQVGSEALARPEVRGPVLLVEDETEVRRVLRLQLTELGYPVLEAEDGIEALSLLESVGEIALLISDTVMPGGIGGRELAQRARALRADLPILLITGYASPPSGAAEIPPGVGLLRKPFDRDTLAHNLAELQVPLVHPPRTSSA